ncbi:MAG: phytanoyl-CoA dioxygenase family protein [Candidatus Hydrogenedentes bacterium]|nr:phytanoyl-CoA dioxygenase family protein [Candidatus Hydrogenedentota bacterium]
MAVQTLAPAPSSLKKEFDERGYVVLRGFFSPEEMEVLLAEVKKAGSQQGREHCLNKDNMVFFGNIARESQVLKDFVTQQRIIDAMRQLAGDDIWIRWDQAVGKYPGGADFPWHQDNAYNKLKDMHFQFWIGLTPMNKQNGGVWLQPGSHKFGLLPHSKVENHLSCDVKPCKEEFIESQPGDVLIFSSLTLHYTTRNYSENERWAWVIEYMSCDFYDPHMRPPYFIASENGKAVQKFADSYKACHDPRARMKYLGARTRENVRVKAETVLAKAGRILGHK